MSSPSAFHETLRQGLATLYCFLSSPLPRGSCLPTPPQPIVRLFVTSFQALHLPECSRDTPVCSLFPGGIHLGHARVSVYGLWCLRLPLGSGLLLVLLAACRPAKELRRPSCPWLLPPPALT